MLAVSAPAYNFSGTSRLHNTWSFFSDSSSNASAGARTSHRSILSSPGATCTRRGPRTLICLTRSIWLTSNLPSAFRPSLVRTPPVVVEGNGKESDIARALGSGPKGRPSRTITGSCGSIIQIVSGLLGTSDILLVRCSLPGAGLALFLSFFIWLLFLRLCQFHCIGKEACHNQFRSEFLKS